MNQTRKDTIQNLAKVLRKNQTDTERFMWHFLKENFPQIHFRRQYQIGNYIADFVSIKHKLVIECDGGGHSKEKDNNRDNFLIKKGFKILRFWNNEILNNPEGIFIMIQKNINIDKQRI